MNKRVSVFAVWSFAALLAACTSNSEARRTASAACASDSECATRGARVCVSGVCQQCRSSADCGAGRVCASNRCETAPEIVATPSDSVAVRSADGGRCFDDVFFGFDDDRIDDPGQRSLRRAAECLSRERTTRYVLIGRADPRGTSEYNLALGERRARAVQRYLNALGVSADRLPVSSEGSEGATGTSEEGWARDRRVEANTASR